MTYREKEILQILKSNPMISQQELADMLNELFKSDKYED